MNLVRRSFDLITRPMLDQRAKKMASLLSKYLKSNEKILDVGCGDLTVAKEIVKKINLNAICIDVIRFNRTHLDNNAYIMYDGKNFPFKNNSFDTVLLSFVLHHCGDQIKVLEEAKRVSKNKIIVLEDVCNNEIERKIAILYDSLNSIIEDFSMALPFKFGSLTEWENIFRKENLEIIDFKRINTLAFNINRQMIFVLKK